MRVSKMDNLQVDLLDFVPRERSALIRRTIAAFFIAGLIIFAIAFMPLGNISLYTPLVAVLLMAILCLFVSYHLQINLDLVTAAEFQNMLYAQALALGSAFSMIVRRDGTIVHTSDNFADIFPGFNYASSQALEGVFEHGTVRKLDRERILDAIHSNTPERLVFPLITQYAAKKDYIITVEPLARPAGFCLIRGREYLGQRAGLQVLPDTLRATSIDKLDHLLTTTTTAHYTADQYGRFEYVNPAFAAMFGYTPNEIVESKLSLHHLFFSFSDRALTEEYGISDYEGPAITVTKTHGRQPAVIRQRVIRDSNGKAVGATGSVISMAP